MQLRLVACLLALGVTSACGAGAPQGSQFVGTWQITNYALNWDCDGVNGSSAATGNIVIAIGLNGDLVTESPDGCDLQWSSGGSTLSLMPAQSCSVTADGVTSNVSWSTGTINGITPTSLSGTAQGAGTANGESCNGTETFSATKISG